MAEARSQTSRRWLWVGVIVILVAVFLVARSLLREHLLVRAAQVQRQQIVNTVSTNGRVEPEHPYQFYSPISTTVKSVYTQVGDEESTGKLLVVLDDVDAQARVASAESAVKAAQAQVDAASHNGTQSERQASAGEVEQNRLTLEQAQHDLQAMTRLESTGAAAPGEVLSAKQRVATAQAALDASLATSQNRYSPDEIARAQAALSDAQASLAAARHVQAQTRIIAPIKGTVYSMDAAPSEFQEQGKLLLQMADLKQQRIRAYFDEPDIGRLAVGQQAIIRWEAKPGAIWHGHITRLPASVVQYTTRIVGEVLIALDDPESGLLPDTNVTVQVTTSSQPNALSMPRAALYSENGQYYVFKIVGSELKRTPVAIGAPTLTEAPILSGLEEGDWVATGTINGEPLQQGVPIKIQR